MNALFLPCNFATTPTGESIYLTSSGLKVGNQSLSAEDTQRFYLFGDILVVLAASGARFINISTMTTLFFYSGHFLSAATLESENLKVFFLGGFDGSIHRLTFSSGRFLFDRKFPKISDSSIVALLALSPDVFLTGDEFGKIAKFSDQLVNLEFPVNGFPLSFFRSSDGSLILVTSGGQIFLFLLSEAVAAAPVVHVKSHGRAVNAAAMRGNFLALGGEDGIVNVWTVDQGQIRVMKSERVSNGLIVGLDFCGERNLKGVCYDRALEWNLNF